MRACDAFFEAMERLCLAVTYAEVLLKPCHSDVMPSAVSIGTYFSRRVPLKIPITSAAMDTVTESRLAIALAKLGGIGVIHKNLSLEAQKDEVGRVKFHLSGKIPKPITVRDDMTIEQVESMLQQRKLTFRSIPVIGDEGRLIGLLTNDTFRYCTDRSRRVSEVMNRDLVTGAPDTSADVAYAKLLEVQKGVLPLVDSHGILTGMYLFNDLDRNRSGRSDMYNVDGQGRLRVAAAIGTEDDVLERVGALIEAQVDVLVIDTAHGDSDPVIRTLRAIKDRYDIDVVAGNVCEGEAAKLLADSGADGVKVGIGPGSICTTRVVSGVGCPQVTAIHNAAKALEGTGVPICADGGIENSGDIPIAIGAGADCVMIGGLFSGTTEAPGEIVMRRGRSMKYIRGMGSLSAMQSHAGSRGRYLQEDAPKDRLVPEGIEGYVPYVGDLALVVHQLVGGLRKGMGYVGASTIHNLQMKADFRRISGSGVRESHPHGVDMDSDAPNYRRQS